MASAVQSMEEHKGRNEQHGQLEGSPWLPKCDPGLVVCLAGLSSSPPELPLVLQAGAALPGRKGLWAG